MQLVSETKLVVDDRRYPFEIPVNDPGLVKVGDARHNLGELMISKDCRDRIREEVASGSPTAGGSPLDWTSRIPSHSRFASSQRRYENTGGL